MSSFIPSTFIMFSARTLSELVWPQEPVSSMFFGDFSTLPSVTGGVRVRSLSHWEQGLMYGNIYGLSSWGWVHFGRKSWPTRTVHFVGRWVALVRCGVEGQYNQGRSSYHSQCMLTGWDIIWSECKPRQNRTILSTPFTKKRTQNLGPQYYCTRAGHKMRWPGWRCEWGVVVWEECGIVGWEGGVWVRTRRTCVVLSGIIRGGHEEWVSAPRIPPCPGDLAVSWQA
jgi:hypothetical protein